MRRGVMNREMVLPCLPDGWDRPVAHFEGKHKLPKDLWRTGNPRSKFGVRKKKTLGQRRAAGQNGVVRTVAGAGRESFEIIGALGSIRQYGGEHQLSGGAGSNQGRERGKPGNEHYRYCRRVNKWRKPPSTYHLVNVVCGCQKYKVY